MIFVMKLFISVFLLFLPFVGHASCQPKEGTGLQDYYELKVSPVSESFEHRQRIRIPRVQPKKIDVKIGLYTVVVKPAKQDEGSRPAKAFGDELWKAYDKALRTPDRLKEFFYGPGREIFDSKCSGLIDRDTKTHKYRAQTTDFAPESEESAVKGAAGSRFVDSCLIPGPEGQAVEARIYVKERRRKVLSKTQDAGTMVIKFRITGQGSAEAPKVNMTFKVTDQKPTVENKPPDVYEQAVNIKVASFLSKIRQEIQRLDRNLNSSSIVLSQKDQDRLCKGAGGVITLEESFTAFDNSDYVLPIRISAVKRKGVNKALGDKCNLIDCDCYNMNAGILNRGYIPQCRSEQKAARQKCRQDGKVHKCHMEGANPSYPK